MRACRAPPPTLGHMSQRPTRGSPNLERVAPANITNKTSWLGWKHPQSCLILPKAAVHCNTVPTRLIMVHVSRVSVLLNKYGSVSPGQSTPPGEVDVLEPWGEANVYMGCKVNKDVPAQMRRRRELRLEVLHSINVSPHPDHTPLSLCSCVNSASVNWRCKRAHNEAGGLERVGSWRLRSLL